MKQNQLSLFIFLALILFSFGLVVLLPFIHQSKMLSLFWLLGESVVFILLIYAWHRQIGRLNLPVLYVLAGLFFFRTIYFLSDPLSSAWYLRSHGTLNLFLVTVFYVVGIIGLHPFAFQFMQRCSCAVSLRLKLTRFCITTAWLAALALCFWMLQSVHITRDGYDWIERTTQPVWHLYLREPLTIALYRLTYLLTNSWFDLNSRNAIALFTIVCSMMGLVCYQQFLRTFYSQPFDRFLGWMLLASFGGLTVLFFGHIEVYPIMAAFLFLNFLCIQNYAVQKWSIIPVAIVFSFTFVIHLSAGWLLPAVICLPLFCSRSNKIRDLFLIAGIFSSFQGLFWGGLIVWQYDGSLAAFTARLHQTFHVGFDRAMFIPPHAWFHPQHIQDWISVYGYLMPCAILLLPLVAWAVYQNPRSVWNPWLFMWLGYFVYTFCWNPDRGYPEDWDLFSPITALTLPVILTLLLPSKPEEDQTELNELSLCLYIAAAGFLPFSAAMIWFHHTQRFISI